MNEAAISNAYDATKVFFQTPQERMDYLNRQMAIMDYNSGMNAAEKRGEARMAALIERLIVGGRIEDARKASSNAEYRNKLYKEMGL